MEKKIAYRNRKNIGSPGVGIKDTFENPMWDSTGLPAGLRYLNKYTSPEFGRAPGPLVQSKQQ